VRVFCEKKGTIKNMTLTVTEEQEIERKKRDRPSMPSSQAYSECPNRMPLQDSDQQLAGRGKGHPFQKELKKKMPKKKKKKIAPLFLTIVVSRHNAGSASRSVSLAFK